MRLVVDSHMHMHRIALLVAMGLGWVNAITGPEIHQATGAQAGLCVVLGTTDGALESELHNGGRMLVHSLAKTEAEEKTARETILGKGLAGLVSVERATGWNRLPYTTETVNLLVADAAHLGTDFPGDTEIDRVLVPGGVSYIRRGGSWSKKVKPQNPKYDNWTHIHYDAGGNPVSKDLAFGPPTGLQWVGGYEQNERDGNGPGASADAINGFRVAGGRAFYQWRKPEYAGRPKSENGSFITGRDAFNGVALWETPVNPVFRAWKEYPFAYDVANDRLLTAREIGQPLVALDPVTGAETQKYSAGPTLLSQGANSQGAGYWALTANNKLIQVSGKTMWVHNAKTGALIYKYEHSRHLANPVYAADKDRIFVAGAADRVRFGRDNTANWSEVMAFDTQSAQPLWTRTLPPPNDYARLIYQDGILVCYRAGDKLAPERRIVRFDVDKGTDIWAYNHKVEDGTRDARRELFIWNKSVGFFKPDDGYAGFLDPSKGEITHTWRLPGKNYGANGARCQLSAATPNWFLAAGIGYLNAAHGEWLIREIARPTCAGYPTIANGMSFTAATVCGCYMQYRGIIALSSHALPDIVDDKARLQKTGTSALTVKPAGPDPIANAGPVAVDWQRNTRALKPETDPVSAAGMSLVAVIDQHRLEARKGSEVVWSFVAGGRISSPPVVVGDRLYFGSHDGWVYALKTSDGSLLWRFMAAATDLKLVSHSQIESAWPVFGVAHENGQLYFSAGRHPELNGGIFVYKIAASDGSLTWKAQVTPHRVWVPKTITDSRTRTENRSMKYWPAAVQQGPTNRMINTVAEVSGGVIKLPGFEADTKTGKMVLNGMGYAGPGKAPTPPPTSKTGAVALAAGGLELSVATGPSHVTLSVHSRGNHSLQITDMAGRRILSTSGYGDEAYVLSRRLLTKGRYVALVESSALGGAKASRVFSLLH